MTKYINSKGISKEHFLNEYGIEVGLSDLAGYDFSDKSLYAVCLVDNGPFRAAAVIADQRNYEEFSSSMDLRPKKYFLVGVDELRNVAGLDI